MCNLLESYYNVAFRFLCSSDDPAMLILMHQADGSSVWVHVSSTHLLTLMVSVCAEEKIKISACSQKCLWGRFGFYPEFVFFVFAVLRDRMVIVGSLWGDRVAAERGRNDTPTVPGLLQSMSPPAAVFTTFPADFVHVCHSSFVSLVRMSISWRSPCFLRECPCSTHSSCLLPNSKKDWTCREYCIWKKNCSLG